jgi:hypothetical protein
MTNINIVTYPVFAWLIRRVLYLMINLVDRYTTDYNSSQITIWQTVIFFRLDTPLELFWLPTELLHYSVVLRCTPTYSFKSSDCVLL